VFTLTLTLAATNDMKKILTLIIIFVFILNIAVLATLTNTVKESFTGSVTAVHTASQDVVIGLWGGKWDDTWPVFLLIETNGEPHTYKVRYQWLENLDDSMFSTRELTGYKTNNYVHAKFLDFRMTETNGMLYGKFKIPRMANLVRLDPSTNPSVENADDLLRKYGWAENGLPAGKAFKKITGP
jgi:hypothetical protein